MINLQAIPLVNTELEMAHLFGLRESASAKSIAKKKLQDLPSGKYYFSWDGYFGWKPDDVVYLKECKISAWTDKFC